VLQGIKAGVVEVHDTITDVDELIDMVGDFAG